MHIKLYVKHDCIYSHSARIALEEKHMNFEVVSLNQSRDLKRILELSPDGLFPILQERDHIIYDPEVVLLYIDERYPTPSLLPNYPVEKARTRLAMTRVEREWYSVINFIMSSQDQNKIKEAKKGLMDSFKAIHPIFAENEFFMSNTMTLADCSLGALLHALPGIGIKLDDSLGEINSYAKRIFLREAFQRTLKKKPLKFH